jgi:F-type H+-transporting ATPase subunit b
VRIRVLIAGALLAASGVLAPAAAFAQESTEGGETAEEEHELDHEAEECIHILEDGGKVDDCQEAPSPILPATDEIVWGAISFVVLFFLMSRFAYPAIKKGMAAREERIRDTLDEAETAKSSAQQVLEDYQRQLADAKGEAGRIIEEARQSADAMRRELLARAETDAAGIRERAQADIQASVDRAKADLQAQVAALSIELAEKVVAANLDRDAQMRLIENYINEVGR